MADEYRSEIWGNTLPTTPLRALLVALHALLLHAGMDVNVLALSEHHMRTIAVFTHTPMADAIRDRAYAAGRAEALKRVSEWIDDQRQALPEHRTPVAHGKAELLAEATRVVTRIGGE